MLNSYKKDILNVIKKAKGRERAIKAKHIKDACGIPDYLTPQDHNNRQLRILIDGLIAEGYPIASCSQGFYYADSEEDYIAYQDTLEALVNGIRHRQMQFKRAYF